VEPEQPDDFKGVADAKAGTLRGSMKQSFVLLPARGLRSPTMLNVGRKIGSFVGVAGARVGVDTTGPSTRAPGIKILHSMHEDGPKLAALEPAEVEALHVTDPEVRAVPLVYYELARLPVLKLAPTAQPASAAIAVALRLTVQDSNTSVPVAGAQVIAFTDFANRSGAEAVTDMSGIATLTLNAASLTVDALVIYGPAGHWGLFKRALAIQDGDALTIDPVNLRQPDYLLDTFGARPLSAGTGVKVGIIDTGVDRHHPDLAVSGGAVFVVTESDAGDFGPASVQGEHGTHVAGIVASRGRAPTGKPGIAAGVTLMSYRVFGNKGGGAGNYDIMRAIERGVDDGCDLLNLSFELGTPDEAVHNAIQAALDRGTVCIAAAGNNNRQGVAYPAQWPEAVAISAVGKTGTFPASSSETVDILAPFAGSDPRVFVAGFSNIGPEIAFTAPGVGILSTLPGGRYGVMSGTSMACPAALGVTAALLASSPTILAMPRDAARTAAIRGLMNSAAKALGFPKNFEGLGVIL